MEGHSSSDDPTRYRDENIARQWAKRDPIERFRNYLELEDLVSDALDREIHAEQKALIDAAIKTAEASPPPDIETLFTDVYAEMPRHLAEQRQDLLNERGGGTNEGAFPL